jgi:hypothetical protein
MEISSPVPTARPILYLSILLGIVFVAFGSFWVFSAKTPDKYMDQDYGQWEAKTDMLRRCELGDLSIIGDSRASAGIVPAQLLPLNVRNLALTGSTPIEGYYELKRILDCPNTPKLLILSYSARQFEEINWFWLHAARYGFFSFSELEEARQAEASIGISYLYKGSFGTEPPGMLKNWLYVSKFPPLNFASMLAARGFRRGQINDSIRRETLESGGQHLEGTAQCATQAGWEATQETFHPNPLVTLYLERLIAMSHQHGVRIYFLMPPVSETTSGRLRSAYQQEFSAFLGQIMREHPDIQLIGPAFPVMDDCSFGDEHHLNQRGAEAFTKRIAPELLEIMTSSGDPQRQLERRYTKGLRAISGSLTDKNSGSREQIR